MNIKRMMLFALAGALPLTMSATTITPGSEFNLTGNLTVCTSNTATGCSAAPNTTSLTDPVIIFNNLSIPNQGEIQPTVLGTFVGDAGQTVGMSQLEFATAPVNTAFSQPGFITFEAADSLPSLTLTFIPQGAFAGTSNNCPAGTAAAGQVCTPNVGATTTPGPFGFSNAQGLTGLTSTANFVFEGTTSDGLDQWQAILSANFGTPYQTVLSNLATNGSVGDGFSGEVQFVPIAQTPEPGSMVMMGIGLLLIGTAGSRLRARAHKA